MARSIVTKDDIKDLSVSGGGHQIFEIFQSLRKDETDIDGAYPCDGREFSKSDFSGGNNPYDMLLLNKAKTLSYEEWNTEVTAKGVCFSFALDTENEKFRIPKLINSTTIPEYTQVTNDIGKSEVLSTGGGSSGINGHHILEIFPTYRTENEIAGAWRCLGQEFQKSDFSGKDNPYTMLVNMSANMGPVVSYTEWNNIYTQNGYCSFFGLDTENEKFKIPYLNNVFLEATSETLKIGEMKEAGLPNVSGNAACLYNSNGLESQTNPFWFESSDDIAIGQEGATNKGVIKFSLQRNNPIYGASDTVQPPAVKVSYMVQLASEYGEISIANIKNEIFIGFLAQVIQSVIPINDDRVRLLNGDVISKDTTKYVEFINYVAGLQDEHPEYFLTEENWQTQNTTYGSCGKFVYNATAGTLRLPNVSNILEGTTVLTDAGNIVAAGLPNIEGTLGSPTTEISESPKNIGTGAFTIISETLGDRAAGVGGKAIQWGFSAANSNSIYGNSTTVQPQTIKALTYIVVATSKTIIEEDIDQKADKSLSNLTKDGKTAVAHLGMPSDQAVELTIGESGQNYTMPADGFLELVAIASGSGYTNFIPQNSGPGAMLFFPASDVAQKMVIPVRKGEIVKLNYESLNKSAQDTGLYFWYSNGSQP